MVTASPVRTLEFTRTISAPLAQVYWAFTDGDGWAYWFSDDSNIRPTVGGHILLSWFTGFHAFGVYTVLEPKTRVAFTWRGAGEQVDSQIEVKLAESDGSISLTLTLDGVNPTAVETIAREWNNALDNLKSVLETGADERLTKRVLLGIAPAELTEELAAQRGLPITDGVRLANVLPGYSAEAAGMRPEDVIVEVEGQAVGRDKPILNVTGRRKPGDVVQVTFYRGAEKHTLPITLKGYNIPPAPATFAELADRIAGYYARYEQELESILAGVTEAEANQSPAEGEWSLKQVMAHLILHERWLHHWIGAFMQGPEESGYSCNTSARIAQVTTVYPTLTAITEALRAAWRETLALAKAIPDTPDSRKGMRWWVAFEIDGLDTHMTGHFKQMREALAAARG